MRKVFAIALVLVLALSLLTACGGNTDTPSGNSTTPSASQNGENNNSGGNNADANWPDNEWTEQLPKPSFAISSSKAYPGGGFIFTCKEAGHSDMAGYVDALKADGFTNEEGGSVNDSRIYWNAKNAAGYKVTVSFNDGNYEYATIQIVK